MLHALATPVLKSVVLAGLLFGAGIGAAKMKTTDHSMRRLSLHTTVVKGDIYLTAFDAGDLRMKIVGELKPMQFEIRASVSDGCRWLGVETLQPIDKSTYSYDYREFIVECDAGATPYIKTPRIGVVVVHDD
ncbi:MAG: hypothetical protein ABI867_35310 [Kofleriaceae bacterium]